MVSDLSEGMQVLQICLTSRDAPQTLESLKEKIEFLKIVI